MKDLFNNPIIEKPVRVNIYADEIQPVKSPYTNEEWFYIGIIVENIENPLLPDIINKRYCGNLDKSSSYYRKNDRVIHWANINDLDTKHIAKRWIEYILNPEESGNKFYAYVLGINNSKLNKEEFDTHNDFNSKYNRFFRSAILYALKSFFQSKKIIVVNIFHEEGQQIHHKYFPWHCIYKISEKEDNITFKCKNIRFLPKSHRKDEKSNLIQLCDLFLGLCRTILHEAEINSKAFEYKKDLLDTFLPLLNRMINNPNNINSRYKHANRIMIRFFPKEKTSPNDINRLKNQFYTNRRLIYKEQISGQQKLF